MKKLDAKRLAAALGASFRAVPSRKHEASFAQVEHVPSATLFAAIPGGTLEMGVSKAELRDLGKIDFCEDVTREQVAHLTLHARTHRVKIAPFLCARAAASGALARRILGAPGTPVDDADPDQGIVRVDATQAHKLAMAFAKDNLRLVTEPEWEWIAREGGARHWVAADHARGAERVCKALHHAPRFDRGSRAPGMNGFGVWGMPWGDFVADAHGTRRKVWGIRGGGALLYPWQTDEILMCVASFGYRVHGGRERAGVRFAIDMPTA